MSTINGQHGHRKATPASTGAAAQRLRVLLVEDSKLLTERLSEALRQIPEVEFIAAVDTEDAARAAVTRERIDVMILDLHLRQGNGFGVLRALAKAPDRPLIVVFTDYDLPQYKDAALALGATRFMDKVRDFDKFPEVMRELIAKVRSRA